VAKNRYRQKARLKRQYTLTGTKAFAAFWLSVFFSLILDSYFDLYGPRVLAQVKDLIVGAASTGAGMVQAQGGSGMGTPQAAAGATGISIPAKPVFDSTFRKRLNQLDKHGATGPVEASQRGPDQP
jgi:hypothetical protein